MRWRWSWLSAVWLICLAKVNWRAQRAHHRRVHADVESFAAVVISRRIEERSRASASGQFARLGRGRRDRLRPSFPSARGESSGAMRFVRPVARRIRGRKLRHRQPWPRHSGRSSIGSLSKRSKNWGSTSRTARPCRRLLRALRWEVGGCLHAPEAMQDDAGERVHHGGEGGYRQDVTRYFDGALFGLACDFFRRLGCDISPMCQMSPRISRASGSSTRDSSR